MPGKRVVRTMNRSQGRESLREPEEAQQEALRAPQSPGTVASQLLGRPSASLPTLGPSAALGSQAVLWPWTCVDCVGRDSSFLRSPLVLTKPLLLLPSSRGQDMMIPRDMSSITQTVGWG